MSVSHVIRSTFIASTLAVALAGAAPVAAQAQEGAEQLPDWLQQAMAREGGKLRTSKVKLGDGFLKAKLAGAVAGPQPIDGGWYLASDIGTTSPLECWVFTETVDVATLTASIADAVMASAAETHGALDNQSIYFVDAGAYDQSPYLALEWLYTVGEAPNALVGLSKVRVAVRDDATLACGHNDPGYRQTFAAAFERFVRSARISREGPTHYYEEVLVQRIGDQSVGVAQSVFFLDEEGDSQIRTFESALIPVDGQTLNITDTWRSTFSRPDGTLINQNVASSENGELTMQLSLAPTAEGAWRVSGTYHGKEIARELDGSAQPVSEIGQMMAVQELFASKDRSNVDMPIWIPAADPTRFLTAGVALDDDGGGNLTLGPMTIAAQFDRTGSMRSGRIQAGVASIEVDRVWVDGTPP